MSDRPVDATDDRPKRNEHSVIQSRRGAGIAEPEGGKICGITTEFQQGVRLVYFSLGEHFCFLDDGRTFA